MTFKCAAKTHGFDAYAGGELSLWDRSTTRWRPGRRPGPGRAKLLELALPVGARFQDHPEEACVTDIDPVSVFLASPRSTVASAIVFSKPRPGCGGPSNRSRRSVAPCRRAASSPTITASMRYPTAARCGSASCLRRAKTRLSSTASCSRGIRAIPGRDPQRARRRSFRWPRPRVHHAPRFWTRSTAPPLISAAC